MPFTQDRITATSRASGSAEKQRNDVLHAVEIGVYDFTLLDTRPREAFESDHILGAWCAPFGELGEIARVLPKDRKVGTYCLGHD